MTRHLTPALLVLAAVAPIAVHAAPIELVIGITNLTTPTSAHFPADHPKVQVPGQPGDVFTNVLNGGRFPTVGDWTFTTTTSVTPTANGNTVIRGSGLSLTRVVQSGVTEFAPTQVINNIGGSVMRFLDNGDWALGNNGSQIYRSVSTVNNGAPSLAFNALTPLPAFPGATLSNGSIALVGNTPTGVAIFANLVNGPVTEAGMLADATSAPAQTLATIPNNQANGTTDVIGDIDTNEFRVDATGNNWLALGELAIASTGPKVLIVNNSVVLQSGQPVPGLSGATIAGISLPRMNSNGDWFARVTPSTGGSAMIRNGQLIASTDVTSPSSLITPNSTDRWTSFTDVIANHRGDWIIVGASNNADAQRRNVAVVNGQRVLLRQSDQVAPASIGAGGPARFVQAFADQRLTFANDWHAYFGVTLKDSATNTSTLGGNRSLVRVRWCDADVAGPNQSVGPDGSLTADDIIVYLGWYFASDARADVAGPNQSPTPDAQFTADDIIVFLGTYFAGC
ncbi:MAG: hypothetical protein MUE97_00175 [Phycisphaerales bacterium]|nr:hypothetical protein [Phycisphaerales bacterium]